MDPQLSNDELMALKALDIDDPNKPALPEAIGHRLIEIGLAIELVEGGLQLTSLGREKLTASSDKT